MGQGRRKGGAKGYTIGWPLIWPFEVPRYAQGALESPKGGLGDFANSQWSSLLCMDFLGLLLGMLVGETYVCVEHSDGIQRWMAQ